LQAQGVGWDIALSDTGRWVQVLEQCIEMEPEEIQAWKVEAARFAANLAKNQPLAAYEALFET